MVTIRAYDSMEIRTAEPSWVAYSTASAMIHDAWSRTPTECCGALLAEPGTANGAKAGTASASAAPSLGGRTVSPHGS